MSVQLNRAAGPPSLSYLEKEALRAADFLLAASTAGTEEGYSHYRNKYLAARAITLRSLPQQERPLFDIRVALYLASCP